MHLAVSTITALFLDFSLLWAPMISLSWIVIDQWTSVREALLWILLPEAALPSKLLLRAVDPDASPELLVWSLTVKGSARILFLCQKSQRCCPEILQGTSQSPSVTDR